MAVEFSCPGENPEVTMHREPPVSIGFGESPIRATDLPRLGNYVGEIIEAFADTSSSGCRSATAYPALKREIASTEKAA